MFYPVLKRANRYDAGCSVWSVWNEKRYGTASGEGMTKVIGIPKVMAICLFLLESFKQGAKLNILVTEMVMNSRATKTSLRVTIFLLHPNCYLLFI
jgi:hypothetical protein